MGPSDSLPQHTVPQAPASPQLLLLAEPLAREGLSGLLGSVGYRLASRLEDLEGTPALVVWDVAATLPAPTLLRELEQLRGRWPGSGLLLLLAADAPYPSTWLLQLPVEGLLQQGEPDELTRAVATLLADPKTTTMIMGNHGVLVVGRTVAETFNRLYYFERAAETYIRALQTGRPLRVLPERVRLFD